MIVESKHQIHMSIGVLQVCALPDDHPNRRHFVVTVEDRGNERYAIKHMGMCLSSSGEWGYESIPSERPEEWLATHRFSYVEAVQRACEAAHTVTCNDLTAADVLNRTHTTEAR